MLAEKIQIMDHSEKVPHYSHFPINFMSLLWNGFALLIRQLTPYSRHSTQDTLLENVCRTFK